MYDLVRTSGVQPKILSKQQLTNTIRTIEKRLRCTSGVLLLLSMTLQVLLLVDSIVAQLPCIFLRLQLFGYLAFGGTFSEHRLHSRRVTLGAFSAA